MFNFLKSKYVASVEARARAIVRDEFLPLAQQWSGANAWSGVGDPFEFHNRAAIAALSTGVAAVYGYDVEGDFAEFGTMTGRTAMGLAQAIKSCDQTLGYAQEIFGHADRKLSLFDSFCGLPDTSDSEIDSRSPHVQAGVWSKGSLVGISSERLSADISTLLEYARYEIHAGWFSDTVSQISSERRFALVHIDSDLYESARDVLSSLFSRGIISRGAYIYFDDWNCNRAGQDFGERRAWRECVDEFDIECSDAGAYGIFAQRFVVHDYKGSPEPRSATAVSIETTDQSLGEMTPDVVAETEGQYQPSSESATDVYDHQAASIHYDQSAGTADMDPTFLPIYEKCKEFSMTSAARLFSVFKAVEYLHSAGIKGDFVECGVWRGGSMMVAAEALKMLGDETRQFHLFDTFEGLPEPTSEDVDVWGHSADKWWQQKKTSNESSDWARASLPEVQKNMALTGYPSDKVVCIQGMVEDTIPARAPSNIALLRLDTDWYASTKHEMEQLFPRLVPNGVLIIDDYGHFKGAKQAVDEYLLEAKLPLMLIRVDYTGRIAINNVGPRVK
tara:strand:- start:14771 stop:16450 length:1680 start_codon:yes stop_codon:yes gene_type:complete